MMLIFETSDPSQPHKVLAIRFNSRLEKLAFKEYWRMQLVSRPDIFDNDPNNDAQLFIKMSTHQDDPGAYISTTQRWIINLGHVKACEILVRLLGFNTVKNDEQTHHAEQQHSILILNSTLLTLSAPAQLHLQDDLKKLMPDVMRAEGFKYEHLSPFAKGLFVMTSIVTFALFFWGYKIYRYKKEAALQEGHYLQTIPQSLPGDEQKEEYTTPHDLFHTLVSQASQLKEADINLIGTEEATAFTSLEKYKCVQLEQIARTQIEIEQYDARDNAQKKFVQEALSFTFFTRNQSIMEESAEREQLFTKHCSQRATIQQKEVRRAAIEQHVRAIAMTQSLEKATEQLGSNASQAQIISTAKGFFKTTLQEVLKQLAEKIGHLMTTSSDKDFKDQLNRLDRQTHRAVGPAAKL